jgi:DNA sulfur modification protein DndE
MKPPVEHVRVSSRGKEILIRVKRHTGLQHWNEICRLALCRSLANPTPPPKPEKAGDSSIEMEWKTFAGPYQQELAALVLFRAKKDGINLSTKEELAEFFRAHLERGIANMQSIKSLSTLY